MNSLLQNRIYVVALLVLLALVLLPAAARATGDDDHGSAAKIAADGHEGHDHDADATAEGHDDHDEDAAVAADGHEGHEDEEILIALSPEEIAEFGIEIAVAGPGVLESEIAVPGEVVVNGDRLAHIMARFPGVVTSVRKNIGDRVESGDVLAVVESNEGLAPYHMTSLLRGVVIDKHITVGEVTGGDGAAFVVADLDTVWVNLSIYQMHLPFVSIGQPVRLSFGQGIPDVTGAISYLSPIVDEHTRTATARVVLPNPEGTLRPGLFAEGHIHTEGTRVPILVPHGAVQTIEDETVVFVVGENGFHPLDVHVGRANSDFVEIRSGLTVGQAYVSVGGFVLKAEIGKSHFGHDHAH